MTLNSGVLSKASAFSSCHQPRRFLALAACCGALLFANSATAAVYTLQDENSLVRIDPTSPAGMYDWEVDGVDQLKQQWFYYRIGNNPEQSVGSLPLNLANTTDPNFDGFDNGFFTRYVVPGPNGFRLEITYTLVGGSANSGHSDIAETIKIVNTGTSNLPMTFFQYVDFDLSGTPDDDSGMLVNPNKVSQGDTSLSISETVISPASTHHELSTYAATLTSLTDGAPTTLNDFSGPILNADVTWAFQWTFNLAPGGTYLISKDKRLEAKPFVVPEPSSVLLAIVGAMGLLPIARRRFKKA